MGNLLQSIGQAKPVSEFINTAGQYQTTQSNLESQRLIQRKAEMDLAEMQRKQEDEGRLIDLEEIPTKFAAAGMGETGKALKAYAEAFGQLQTITAPDGSVKRFIRKGDALSSLKDQEALMKNAPNHILAFGWSGYLDKKGQLSALEADQAKGKPVDPNAIEKAKRDAQAALATYTEVKRAMEGKDPIKPNVYKPDDFIQQPDGSFIQMPSKETEQWSEPFSGKVGGKEILLRKNIKTGKVEQVSAGPVGGTVVNVGNDLERGARTKAQEEVQEGTDLYLGLQRVLNISRPEYFTYMGQIQAKAEKIGEKAGVVKDPSLLSGYSAWKVGVEQEFNKYRKWVTGVAAGPVELELIRQTFPNKDMSQTEFQAAAQQTAITTWKLVERRRRALAEGIMDPNKQRDFYKLIPLDAMPDPPPEFMARFSGASGTPRTAEEYFQKKGR
jgi:hypothetical protein